MRLIRKQGRLRRKESRLAFGKVGATDCCCGINEPDFAYVYCLCCPQDYDGERPCFYVHPNLFVDRTPDGTPCSMLIVQITGQNPRKKCWHFSGTIPRGMIPAGQTEIREWNTNWQCGTATDAGDCHDARASGRCDNCQTDFDCCVVERFNRSEMDPCIRVPECCSYGCGVNFRAVQTVAWESVGDCYCAATWPTNCANGQSDYTIWFTTCGVAPANSVQIDTTYEYKYVACGPQAGQVFVKRTTRYRSTGFVGGYPAVVNGCGNPYSGAFNRDAFIEWKETREVRTDRTEVDYYPITEELARRPIQFAMLVLGCGLPQGWRVDEQNCPPDANGCYPQVCSELRPWQGIRNCRTGEEPTLELDEHIRIVNYRSDQNYGCRGGFFTQTAEKWINCAPNESSCFAAMSCQYPNQLGCQTTNATAHGRFHCQGSYTISSYGEDCSCTEQDRITACDNPRRRGTNTSTVIDAQNTGVAIPIDGVKRMESPQATNCKPCRQMRGL